MSCRHDWNWKLIEGICGLKKNAQSLFATYIVAISSGFRSIFSSFWQSPGATNTWAVSMPASLSVVFKTALSISGEQVAGPQIPNVTVIPSSMLLEKKKELFKNHVFDQIFVKELCLKIWYSRIGHDWHSNTNCIWTDIIWVHKIMFDLYRSLIWHWHIDHAEAILTLKGVIFWLWTELMPHGNTLIEVTQLDYVSGKHSRW